MAQPTANFKGERVRDLIVHYAATVLVCLAGCLLMNRDEVPYFWMIEIGIVMTGLGLALAIARLRWWAVLVAVVATVYAVHTGMRNTADGEVLELARQETAGRAGELVAALNKYQEQNDGTYPEVFGDLVNEGSLASLPSNPYSGLTETELSVGLGDAEQHAIALMQPIGCNSLSDRLQKYIEPAGNFAYLPRITVGADGTPVARGYSLLVFGDKCWEPGWEETAQSRPVVVYYRNSETGVEHVWE